MPFVPNTTIYLCNVPIDETQENQLYFANLSNQTAYFTGRQVHSYSNVTYQRKDSIAQIPAHIDTLWNCNYVMYQNTNYSNKWFYGFITKMEYINDNFTAVSIKTDVFQTWYFEKTMEESFVERAHIPDIRDNPRFFSANEENLETGEYVIQGYETIAELRDLRVICGTTLTPGEESPQTSGTYHGVPSAITYTSCGTKENFFTAFNQIRNQFSDQPDVIVNLFAAPAALTTNSQTMTWLSGTDMPDPVTITKEIQPPITLGDYTPKNKKLLQYPYNYLLVTNGAGQSATYRYEDFTNEYVDFSSRRIAFDIKGALCVGCSIKLIPKYYKGVNANYDEGLNLAKYPSFNWTSDQFTAWMAQNGVNVTTSIIGAIGGLAGSVAAGAAVGAAGGAAVGAAVGIVNAAGSVANSLNQVHKAELMPPQVHGNTNSGDISFATNIITFHFYKMCIKPEYARILDDYFELYGYKINRLDVPEFNTRPHWNYIKTIGCNITGAIPSDDMAELKRIFDNGVTVWKNPSEVGDYSLDNHND